MKDVKGIGAKRYEKIKGELTVVGAPPKPAAKSADASSQKPAGTSSPPQRMAKGTVNTGTKREEQPTAKP